MALAHSRAHYDTFRDQLTIAHPAFGHALWEPDPGEFPPVEVGDVGFIRDGKFHRLFNVLLPANHPSHESRGVPEGYEQLQLRFPNHIDRGTLSPNNFYSYGVNVVSGGLEALVTGIGTAEVSFSCTKKTGAVLSLPVTAQREDTLARGHFRKWITRHISSWFAFTQELGLGIEMEDIVLVTGCHRTRSWSNIAFNEVQSDARLSLGVEVAGALGASVNWRVSSHRIQGAVLGHRTNGENLPEDQCIFIRGFRVKRVFGIIPWIRAAAEPKPDTPGSHPEPENEVILTPSVTEYRDPLHVLLEYIAKRAPNCDMVLVHDDDLGQILGGGAGASLETLQPDGVMDYLERSKPEVEVVSDSQGLPANDPSPRTDANLMSVAMLSEQLRMDPPASAPLLAHSPTPSGQSRDVPSLLSPLPPPDESLSMATSQRLPSILEPNVAGSYLSAQGPRRPLHIPDPMTASSSLLPPTPASQHVPVSGIPRPTFLISQGIARAPTTQPPPSPPLPPQGARMPMVSRPNPEKILDRLEFFFPDHDVDKPVIEASSGGTSLPAVEYPPAPYDDRAVSKHKKSIRVVAEEHNRRQHGTSPSSAANVIRSTKFWDSRVEEVTPGEITSVMPSTADSPSMLRSGTSGPKPIFKWVRGELIGKGNLGRVYLAMNATTGEMIAVKQVEITRTASSSRPVTVIEALKHESETLKDLDHPNIVQYLGFEETLNFVSMFLEYVPGGTVGSCLRKYGRFEHNVTKYFTEQILSGLEYLHSKGILHRDLIADNILVEGTGICKISDFDFSKRTDDINEQNDSDLTAVQGTAVFWMAPEVIKTRYSAKADIWSVGCVVLEMWTGERPWRNEEPLAVLVKLYSSKQAPPIPSGIILDDAADDFRKKCFAINPDERPSAADLRKHNFLHRSQGWAFNGLGGSNAVVIEEDFDDYL